MTFDTAGAYRILSEKQQRLYDEAGHLTWNAIYARIQGRIDINEERRILQTADKVRDQGAKMYDVLEYLRERMEEES